MTARSQRERLIAAVDACLSAGLEVYVVAGIPGEGMPIKALQAGWPALTSSPLSLLQREVLTHFAVGHSVTQIAMLLNLCAASAATHLKRARQKVKDAGFPCINRVETFSTVQALGLIP